MPEERKMPEGDIVRRHPPSRLHLRHKVDQQVDGALMSSVKAWWILTLMRVQREPSRAQQLIIGREDQDGILDGVQTRCSAAALVRGDSPPENSM